MRPVPRGERTQVMAAIAGIDIALWDLKGKALELPIWRLLGGENRPLATYATGGYYRPGAPNSEYAEEMARFLDLGYRAVKLKTGAGGVADEAERVRAVRAAIGEAPDLMLDMNAPYDLADCAEFARRVEPQRIFWLEEPLHWYLQPADFARLAAATPIPLAHGERELTRFTVRDFIVNRRHPLCAVRCDAGRRVHRGPARRRPRRTARRHRRAAYRAGDPRPSRTGAAALRLRRRVAWRTRDRPARPWAVPGPPRAARRVSTCRRRARLRSRTGLGFRGTVSGVGPVHSPGGLRRSESGLVVRLDVAIAYPPVGETRALRCRPRCARPARQPQVRLEIDARVHGDRCHWD